MADKVRVWSHRRKGRIVGTVIEESDTWITIVLTETHRHGDVGERMTFRRDFAEEVTDEDDD